MLEKQGPITQSKFYFYVSADIARDGCFTLRADRPVGLWHLSNCSTSLPFICSLPRAGFSTPIPTTPTTPSTVSCADSWAEFGNKCYKVRTVAYSITLRPSSL